MLKKNMPDFNVNKIIHIPLNTSDTEDYELYKYISKIVGKEINNLSKPCYKPNILQYRRDIQARLKISDEFIKNYFKDFDYNQLKVVADPFTELLIIAIVHFIKENKPDIAKIFYLFLAIKLYNIIHNTFFPKFCSNQLWELTQTKLSDKHLFKVHNGVANTISYLSNTLFDKYKPNLLLGNNVQDNTVQRMVYELIHRINQSTKAFANKYYALQKESNIGITSDDENNSNKEPEITNVNIVTQLTQYLCTYKQIDNKAITIAIDRSGINYELGKKIISELCTNDYYNDVYFILLIMFDKYVFHDICNENKRIGLVRSISANMRTGKYLIKDEIIKKIKNLKNTGPLLKNVYDQQIIIFITQFLTLYTKNKVC